MTIPTSGLRIAMLSIHSSPIGKLGAQDTGGMSVYIREVAKVLGAQGHRVDIYTSIQTDHHPSTTQLYTNVRLIHLKTSASARTHSAPLYPDLSFVFQALETHRQNESIEYDLIHSHYWLSGIVGAMAQQQWHRPHLMTFHTVGDIKERAYPGEKESKLRLAHEKTLAETCDHLVVSTQQEREFFTHHYHIPAGKLWVVPCGVNLDRFQPADKIDNRRRLNLDEKACIMLYVGRFVPIKGLNRLIDTMACLQDRLSFRLILVGGDGAESPAYGELLSKIERMGLQDSVIFAGRIDQRVLPLYYNAADVLILPSYHESFGIVAMEALACGTPVIATPVGAMPAVLEDGINGLIVNDAAPQPFARQIEEILAQIGSHSVSPEDIRASVIDMSWQHAATILSSVYDGAMKSAP